MKDLKGQIVLITGGGSGIGRLMAKSFAKEGARIVLWDIQKELMERTAAEISEDGGTAWSYVCDVSDRHFIYDVADKVKKEVGKVDILVNNAGIASGKPFMELEDEQIIRTMEINTMAHFWTVKSFLPEMIRTNHGHIVTVASAAGTVGVAGLADYCASKFAAFGFDESMRMELKKQKLTGVKTTVVCPYYIDTGMFEGVKTRFSFLLPIMKEDYAVKKIMSAVKNDQAVLKLPWMVNTVPLLRVLPTGVMDWMADLLGISNSMDDFVGRGKEWSMKKVAREEA